MDRASTIDAASVGALALRVRAVTGSLADGSADLADLPAALHGPLRAVAATLPVDRHADAVRTMASYCGELEDIAVAFAAVDDRELELDAQLRWWDERITQLETQSRSGAGSGTAADHGIAREISLFRGRTSGAQSMLRHYAHERTQLTARYELAHTRCAAALQALLGG